MFEIAFVLFVCAACYYLGRAHGYQRGRGESAPTFDPWNTCRPPMTQTYKDALRALELEPSSNRCTRCGRNYDPARNWRMDCFEGTCVPRPESVFSR